MAAIPIRLRIGDSEELEIGQVDLPILVGNEINPFNITVGVGEFGRRLAVLLREAADHFESSEFAGDLADDLAALN